MSRTLNKVMLIGRLGQAVELRYTAAGTAVATFSLATNRYIAAQDGGQAREETEWHNIVAWDKLAETCNEYLQKGSQIYVEGRLQTRSWEDQQGVKRYKTEIVASQMMMLDHKPPTAEVGEDHSEPVAAPTRSNGTTARSNGNGSGRPAARRPVEEAELEAEELPF